VRHTWRVLAVGCVVLALTGCGTGGSKVKLSVSGSTFVKPAMDKWIDVYSQDKGGVEINYQGHGSTAGIKQMTEKAVNFGCTDAFMTKEQLATARQEGGEVVHIPLVMGGVVPAYNLPGVDKPLNFTGKVLALIFSGKITNWDDDQIQADNKDVKLPSMKISVVNRKDGKNRSQNVQKDSGAAGSFECRRQGRRNERARLRFSCPQRLQADALCRARKRSLVRHVRV